GRQLITCERLLEELANFMFHAALPEHGHRIAARRSRAIEIQHWLHDWLRSLRMSPERMLDFRSTSTDRRSGACASCSDNIPLPLPASSQPACRSSSLYTTNPAESPPRSNRWRVFWSQPRSKPR